MTKVCIVGAGPGDPSWLTDRARAATARGDAIPGRGLNPVPLAGPLDGKRVFVQHPRDSGVVAAEAAAVVRANNDTAAFLIEQGVDPATAALVGESLALPGGRGAHARLATVATRTFHRLPVLVVSNPTGINPLWVGRTPAPRKEA